VDDEPATIDGNVIAEHLDAIGRPRMADFVRWMATMTRDAGRRERELRDAYAGLLERLHRHEPPAPAYRPPDFTPPPEASD
jgi:hypothetical protein